IGDYMKPIYTNSNTLTLVNRLKSFCFYKSKIHCDSQIQLLDLPYDDEYPLDNDKDVLENSQNTTEILEYVYRDLFLWAILTNRVEIAKVIVSHMQNRICASLIASKVFKTFYSIYAADNDSKETVKQLADNFESYACECLKCCYNYDEEKACEIAIRRIKLFGGVSCIQIAVDADNKEFVGQPCCDQLLTNIWYDKINPIQTQMKKKLSVLFNILTFGLFAHFIVNFRVERMVKNQTIKNELIINENEQSEDKE
ncbi:unnamed protein product, partial [Didymodactylos carnosus]